jgi:hypothetical protein
VVYFPQFFPPKPCTHLPFHHTRSMHGKNICRRYYKIGCWGGYLGLRSLK